MSTETPKTRLASQLWGLLREEFFPNGLRAALAVAQITIWLVSALGLYVGLLEVPDHLHLATDGRFQFYLWITFFSSTVLLGSTIVLLQRLLSMDRRRQHEQTETSQRSRAERQISEHAIKLQHEMAEAVRLSAVLGEQYDITTRLDALLGSKLRAYLQERLGTQTEFHVTVKQISRGSDDGYALTDKFRDSDQDKHTRPRRQTEQLTGNYVYERFKNPPSEDSRQIYVPDIDKLDRTQRSLTARAKERGYRSILAFPLNVPAHPSPQREIDLEFGGLIGFLGIDSPTAGAFDALFEPELAEGRDSSSSELSNRATPKAREEQNLFYGLADAVATILILTRKSRVPLV